jgi:hypothetical protein
VCIVEHQLSGVNSNQLEVSCEHEFFIRPAKSTGDYSSGGIMIGVNKSLKCVLLETNDTFVAVDLGHTVILAVYMPTNYRNEQSNERFAKAYASVLKISHKIRASGKPILLCDDFNADLTIPSLPWSQILLSSLPKDLTVATDSRNYTYVHNSGCGANLDFIISDIESLKKSLVKVI